MGKDEERLEGLNNKFEDIKTIRDRIIAESTDVANALKKTHAQRKMLSPEGMVKNLKSISSFLDNFGRMMSSLSQKVEALALDTYKIDEKAKQINKVINSKL